jgi:WD40 repeat protein
VKLWETQEGRQMKSWGAHGTGVLCVSFAHNGQLVTCGRDLAVVLWNANGGKVRTFGFDGDHPHPHGFQFRRQTGNRHGFRGPRGGVDGQ